jgi:hypothetical protein
MDILDIRAELEDQGCILVKHTWIISKHGMWCNHEGLNGAPCCEDTFSTTDEAIEYAISLCDGELSSIEKE